jgi:hypothetical protein
MKLFSIALSSAAALAVSAGPLLAHNHFWWIVRPRPVRVPEIDASTGLIAVAAVAAALALAWERRRRAA